MTYRMLCINLEISAKADRENFENRTPFGGCHELGAFTHTEHPGSYCWVKADPLYQSFRLTSGPFGDSMSAAARPKRWGVFRQAKIESSIPPGPNFPPYLLDGACH
jgi:hypothetical protein